MNDNKIKELLRTLPQTSQDKLEEIIAQSLLDEALKTGENPTTIGNRLLKDKGEKQMSYKAFVIKLMDLVKHKEKAEALSEKWKEVKPWATHHWYKKIVDHLDQHPEFTKQLVKGRSV